MFRGKLPSGIDKEEYVKKKSNTFKEKEVEEVPEFTRLVSQRNLAILMAKEPIKYSHKAISDRFKAAGHDLSDTFIGKIVRNLQKTS